MDSRILEAALVREMGRKEEKSVGGLFLFSTGAISCRPNCSGSVPDDQWRL